MPMETQHNVDNQENWWSAPGSPIDALCKRSKDAFKLADDSLSNSNPNSPVTGSHNSEFAACHRRSQSEGGTFHKSISANNLLRLKSHLQRAFQWASATYPEDRHYTYFDPEILANEKRQWYQLQSKMLDPERFKEPTSLFEHFVILGLRPGAVSDAFATRSQHFRQHSFVTLEPQVLFKYPREEKLPLNSKDLAAFCYPGGAKEHLSRDDVSFIFSLKVADNATVYGVCLHVPEFIQSNFCSDRLLVTASRCYCILTKVPFFELHYEVLNCVIAHDNLSRVNHIANGIDLNVSYPTMSKNPINRVTNSYGLESDVDWMASTIPVESRMGLSPATEGSTISDDEVPSPSSGITSASDYTQMREENDGNNDMHVFDDFNSDSPGNQSDCFKLKDRIHDTNCASDAGPCICQQNLLLECVQNFKKPIRKVRSMELELEDEEIFYTPHKDDSYKLSENMENKNHLLQIISGYYSIPVPARGSEIIFRPLEYLQPIRFQRSPVSALEFCNQYHGPCPNHFEENPQVKLKLAAAEEALSLSLWSTATICQVLSLENVLALVSAVLLEKQVVVLCQNLGVLSAVVLSIIPIIHPFQWQSLFLPILPEKMLDFLDAPVPFVVGMQHKSDALAMKTSDLVEVDVVKNQVKSCNLPLIPQHRTLIKELRPAHSVLSRQGSTYQKQPIYKCNEIQVKAAVEFLSIMRRHVESLCSDLWSHTITSVESNNDRVSILLKDSFIDSFPVRDQPFVELLVDTQLFTSLSDSILASYWTEH